LQREGGTAREALGGSCCLRHELGHVENDAMLLSRSGNFGPARHWNCPTVPPTLHGGMIAMLQLAGHFANAPKAVDHLAMGFHVPLVRSERTYVNDENVQPSRDTARMAERTVGEKLIDIRRRSGMTMDELAREMGYAGRSSVQRFFMPHLESIDFTDAMKLADVLDGRGHPKITRQEIVALSGVSMLFEAKPNDNPAPKYMELQRDVPVYGTALGTFRSKDDGPEIEQAFIDYSDTMDFFTRPPGYPARTGLYGIFIAGSSMEPRWEAGDPAYVDPKRPPLIGDDVIVYLVRPTDESEEPEAVLIKRLTRRSGSFIELEQFNPPLKFQVDTKRIKAVHRVIPRRELLAFH
jgi:transcriptional regulator with XRE-family HTH domain